MARTTKHERQQLAAQLLQQSLQNRVTGIHEAGAQRHGGNWLSGNMRAVEVIWGSSFSPTDLHVKSMVSLIVLRVLDGYRMEHGEQWNATAGHWEKREQ